MEESNIKLHMGAAGAGAGAPAGEGAGKKEAARPEGARNIIDYVATAASASKLRQDGEDFVANIVSEATRSYQCEMKVTKVAGSNYEARVLSFNGLAIMLVFHDTFIRAAGDLSKAPTISVFQDAKHQYDLRGGKDEIIQALVITKELYSAPEKVAAGLVNTFRACDNVTFKNFAIQDFNAGGELHISMNLKDVLAFADSVSATPVSHADSGILLYVKRRKAQRTGYAVDGNDFDMVPILAVTGFTDFKRVPADPYNSTWKFLPTYVITGCYSPIKIEEMGLLGVALAADTFIGRNKWLDPFMSFSAEGRNLGSLVLDEKSGKPKKCINPAQVSAFMQTCFTTPTPLLAIDLQEGADAFPGMRELLNNPDKIKRILSNFTGGANVKNVQSVVQAIVNSYDGQVETNKGRLDTRAIDYMFLIDPKGAAVNPDRAGVFLEYADPNDPRAIEKKVAALEEIFNKSDILYKTHRAFLDPDFVKALAMDMSASINIIIDSYVSNQAYDISGLRTFAPNMGGMFMGAGNGGGGFMSRGFAW